MFVFHLPWCQLAGEDEKIDLKHVKEWFLGCKIQKETNKTKQKQTRQQKNKEVITARDWEPSSLIAGQKRDSRKEQEPDSQTTEVAEDQTKINKVFCCSNSLWAASN